MNTCLEMPVHSRIKLEFGNVPREKPIRAE